VSECLKKRLTDWIICFVYCGQFGYVIAALNASLVSGDGDSSSACYHDTDDSSDGCPPGTLYNDILLSTSKYQFCPKELYVDYSSVTLLIDVVAFIVYQLRHLLQLL
jgi:hypothetical protein